MKNSTLKFVRCADKDCETDGNQHDGTAMSKDKDHTTKIENLDPGTMTGLLKIGIIEKQRPVDRLLDRLIAVDGGEWFSNVIQEPPFNAVFADAAVLCQGPVERVEINSLKSKGKRLSGADRGQEDRLRGTLAYMLSVAAGLVHLEEMVSSQPAEVLEPVLQDLSGALSDEWSTLFASAAAATGAYRLE